MKSRTVCVIGAGVIGLCCAEALLQRGFDIIVLDPASDHDSASYGNGGLIVPSHFEPLATPGLLRTGLKMLLKRDRPFGLAPGFDFAILKWIARFVLSAKKSHVEQCAPVLRDLHLASRELYSQMENRLGFAFGYEKRGLAMVCESQEGLEGERMLLVHAQRLGLQGKEISGEDLLDGKLGAVVQARGAIYFEDDAQLSPRSFMDGMRACLKAKGVQFVHGSADSFRTEGKRLVLVKVGGKELDADEFVLCAGVWSSDLAKTIGLNIPMLAGRGCGFSAPGVLPNLDVPLILTEARIAITPYGRETRFVGLMELGKPGFGCSPRRVSAMRKSACSALPGLALAELEELPLWVGNRPCTPDGMPVIGTTQKWENLILATGHAMMGMSLGPITGQLVAQVVVQDRPSIDLALLSPDRFR